MCLWYKRRSMCFNPLPLSVSLRSIIMTSLVHSVSYLLFQPPPLPPVLLFLFLFWLFGCLFVVFLVFVCFVASDVLTTIYHLAIVNVCVIIILSIAYCILLLCFLYLFAELMITMNKENFVLNRKSQCWWPCEINRTVKIQWL